MQPVASAFRPTRPPKGGRYNLRYSRRYGLYMPQKQFTVEINGRTALFT